MEVLFLGSAFVKSLLFVFAAVLPIINPLATVPLFVDLTRGLDTAARAALTLHIGRNIIVLLAVSMLVGSHVLRFFGISLPVVRIAGGLVVASIAWQLLGTREAVSADKAQMAQNLSQEEANIRAFYPLTFPLTCGPGAISVTIALGASLRVERVSVTMANMLGGLLAVGLLGLTVAITFRYADVVLRRFGRVGHIVLLRLIAFLLLCIGIAMVWEGASALLHESGIA